MREGSTLTRIIEFETRQHSLWGLDLGEGPPRGALVVGGILFPAWWLLLWLTIGPINRFTSLLWVLPPAVVLVFGWRRSESNPRRRNITQWLLQLRWLIVGHRPIRSLGRQPIRRAHITPLPTRLSQALGAETYDRLTPWRSPGEQHQAKPFRIRANRSAQIVSTAQVEAQWRRRMERRAKQVERSKR